MNKNKSHHHRNMHNKRPRKFNLFRSGQIFGIVYHLALFLLLYILVEKGESKLALKVFVINAGIVLSAFIISTLERMFFKSFKKGSNRHRREKQYRQPNNNDSELLT